MDINKAIKKQNASYKRFIVGMSFVFVILPFSMFISRQFSLFFLVYLVVIEILVLLSIGIKINYNTLKYEVDAYKLKIKTGFPGSELNILCQKVDVIHAEGTGANMQLIFISKSRLRNKLIKPVDAEFLKEYPYAGYHYGRLKKNNPENEFYFTVIKYGGYKKFLLLNELYKACTGAFFTEEAISQIKIYRNSKV